MNLRTLLPAAAAIGLMAAPLAAEQTDSEISRAAAPVESESSLGGRNSLLFFAGIAVVVAAIFLLSEDGDDESVSA